MTVKTFLRNAFSYFFKFEMRTGFDRIYSLIFKFLEITGTNVFRESFFKSAGDKVRVTWFYLCPVFAVFASSRCAFIYWEDKEEVISAMIATMTLTQVRISLRGSQTI